MRNRGEVDARRRALAGLLSDEQPAPGGGSASTQTTTASASPVKRRKIEQHHAQVEMAQLDLELAYCDGGKYKETSTRPESVLYQNDDGTRPAS